MRRADRLFRLIGLMRNVSLIRAQDLADDLEVSVRTVYRDIAHLQGAGLPIDGEAGMGYRLMPGFDLPAMTLTYEEIDALAIGLKFVEEAGDSELVAAAVNLRSKIQHALPLSHEGRLHSAPFFAARKGLRAPKFAKQLRLAIRSRRVVDIVYEKGEQKPTRRRIWPLSMTVFSDGWMLAAWCELRADFRYFRLDRMTHFDLLEERFPDDPERSLTRFNQIYRDKPSSS